MVHRQASMPSFWLRLGRWLPALVCMALIFMASADSGSGEQSGHLVASLLQWLAWDATTATAEWLEFLLRKSGHFLEYALLALAYLWALGDGKAIQAKTLGASWVLTLGYAHSDELHQAWVPQRGPALRDVWLDAVGGAWALLCIALFVWWRHRTAASACTTPG